jgi:hypothetical protein
MFRVMVHPRLRQDQAVLMLSPRCCPLVLSIAHLVPFFCYELGCPPPPPWFTMAELSHHRKSRRLGHHRLELRGSQQFARRPLR